MKYALLWILCSERHKFKFGVDYLQDVLPEMPSIRVRAPFALGVNV
jgi:hypothetical protein